MAELAATTTGNNNVTIQIVGDNNTVGGASLRLVPWRDEAIDRPVERDVQILNPAYRAVTMVGREDDLGFFKGWLEGGGIRATAVVGRGGAGKTRFALELLAGLGEDWQGGFLKPREACRVLATENLGRWVWRKNTLIVVDYAASLRTELAGWLEQLASHGASEFGLRILLLERHAKVDAGWYKELVPAGNAGDRVAGMLEPREPRELTELPVALRRQVLAAGLEAVARVRGESKAKLPVKDADAQFEARLAEPRWADPLLLLMAALVAYQNGVVEALGLSRADVARRAAAREAARLKRRATDTQGDPLLIHLYACAILRGTLSREEARDEAVFCKTQGLEYDGGPARAVADLQRLTGASGTFERLEPDLLAEAFLLEDEELADGQAVLRMAHGGLAEVVRILKLAAQDLVGAEEHRPVEWLEGLLADEALTYEMLQSFVMALGLGTPTTALRGFRVKVLRKMLKQVEAGNPIERAGVLNDLSVQQRHVGDLSEALASILEAVELYRGLYVVNPAGFAADLARSLNNLSNQQDAVGDRTAALQSILEAVVLYRGLHAVYPSGYLSTLASSLNTLSNAQSEVGDRIGALETIRESVDLCRRLYEVNPDAHASDLLASLLNNLSNRQADLGDRIGALESIRESVSIRQDLYGANPDGFAQELAQSLNNLAGRQYQLGDTIGALESVSAATRLCRALYVADRNSFAADLGQSLNNLSIHQLAGGDFSAALESIREAVDIHRALYILFPDRFGAVFARSLMVFGRVLYDLERNLEARDAAKESLRVMRPVYLAYPKAVEGVARTTVVDYVRRSEELGLAVDEELLGVYRGLFEEAAG